MEDELSKVRLTGYILVADEDLSAVKQALPLHRKLTLAESGCVSFEVLPDNKNPNKYNVMKCLQIKWHSKCIKHE